LDRLSSTATECPPSTSRRTTLDPMKPAPPVTRTFIPSTPSARQRSSTSAWQPNGRAAIAQDDAQHRAGHALSQVLRRHDPVPWPVRDGANACCDAIWVGAAQNVAATFQRFGTLGNVAQRDRRDPENAAFLLYRTAVG